VNNSINFIRKNKNILYTDVEINEIGNIEDDWEETEEINMDEIFLKCRMDTD
jgi:RNA polymerase sigma-70 factor (ECF subfamily)